jgi:hypothetical protein
MAMREQNARNLQTEKEGIVLLRRKLDTFFVPSKDQKIELYKMADIDYTRFFNAIDGVISNKGTFDDIKTTDDFQFVEIKTTKSKTIKKLPYGVFFGITKNEEDLFKSLDNYRLCIVHIDMDDYVLLDFEQYSELIGNKRTQYQVSFKPYKPDASS